MTLQQLKYVVTIATKGTISKAAAELFVSQPSLTNAVKELETELGFAIFDRTNKGVNVSSQGSEFLGYARQTLQQYELLEERYLKSKTSSPVFSVSTQHYPFAVTAFVELIKEFDSNHYDFMFRETQTNQIIEDVGKLISEIGVIYKSSTNEVIIDKLLKQNSLVFEQIFTVKPHIFLCKSNPLSCKKEIAIEELASYPYVSFEQGNNNSFYYSEEIFSEYVREKNIRTSDRATMSNLLIGLNGYTIGTGITDEDLNGKEIISIPLISDEIIKIGIIKKSNINLSIYAEKYTKLLKSLI